MPTIEKIDIDTIKPLVSHSKVFDPRLIGEEKNTRTIWSTESVNLAINGLMEGYELKESPFFSNKQKLQIRKANLPFRMSTEEETLFELAMFDKELFADNFCQLKDGEHGWRPIELRPYQRNLLDRYTKNRWNILLFPRQSGKTTTTVIEIVHFLIFNQDKDCVVIAQSDKVIDEIFKKVLEVLSRLPFWLQPGFRLMSTTEKSFSLDNGCRFKIGIASESVVQGYALDFLIIDEFAYIKQSIVRKFWNNVYPTLDANKKSRIIIMSTPNGRNMFWEMWVAAESKKNFFIPYRIYWYDVPGHDEQWKIETIANMCNGDMEAWEMGYECSFDTQLKSIHRTETQKVLRHIQLEHANMWSNKNDALGSIFDGIAFIDKKIINYNFKTDYFLIGVDLAEGLEQDSTVFKIKKVDWDTVNKKMVYRSVAVFNSNDIGVEDAASMLMELLKHFDNNKVRLIVENNTYGAEFFLQLKTLKLNRAEYGGFDFGIIAKFERKSKKDYEYGIRWNGTNKKIAVKSFSQLVSQEILQESHYQSIEEYLNFGKTKNNTYAAQYGHDDLVMADVSISHYIKTNNMFANAFLKDAESCIRASYNDESAEVKALKAEKKRKEESIYTRNGYVERNHADYVKDVPFVFGL